ncbi:peroxiredoxin-like family protein [Desulfoplanes formicivorans]|uniref:thioredoxin-dependent peroxiredoxin n=1 Tax=Desulfoplanes formicivorans TaxID=1592317 RepID=A0A194ADF1_9BACT|nr:peroxiredoxin-like family protein [Desulfoplanes formicivorans]GAU07378.1 alkyl hydroperoxide reductase [Desulfoplanes formicivorans]
MSLTEKLAELKAQNLAKIPKDAQKIMLADLEKLAKSDLVENAPKQGDTLKDFTLPNHNGETRHLATLRQNGPVVIIFYRGGWCPYCNMELHAYQQALPDIKAAGATLVAITPELPDASLTTAEKHGLEFEVLTDQNSTYAREIGIVFTLSQELRPIYTSFGIDIEGHNGKNQFDLPLAATFVVDTNGTIAYAFVAADYTLRADPADVVKALRSLKK